MAKQFLYFRELADSCRFIWQRLPEKKAFSKEKKEAESVSNEVKKSVNCLDCDVRGKFNQEVQAFRNNSSPVTNRLVPYYLSQLEKNGERSFTADINGETETFTIKVKNKGLQYQYRLYEMESASYHFELLVNANKGLMDRVNDSGRRKIDSRLITKVGNGYADNNIPVVTMNFFEKRPKEKYKKLKLSCFNHSLGSGVPMDDSEWLFSKQGKPIHPVFSGQKTPLNRKQKKTLKRYKTFNGGIMPILAGILQSFEPVKTPVNEQKT